MNYCMQCNSQNRRLNTTFPSTIETMQTKEFDYVFKLVVIGDSFVGKTTLLQTYAGNKEVGVHRHLAEKVLTRNGRRIKLQIYDTMGQERYRSLTTSYYRGANGCLVCFDKRTPKSFKNIQTFWMSDLDEFIGEDFPKILVGINKRKGDNDIQYTSETDADIARSEVLSLGEKHSMPYMEVGMGSTDDIDSVFAAITDLMVASMNDYVPRQDPDIVSVRSGEHYDGKTRNGKVNSSCSC